MDSAMDNHAKHNENVESASATAMDANPDTADSRRARRWLERNEIAAKCNEIEDLAGQIDHP
jgi:hypothetical protein